MSTNNLESKILMFLGQQTDFVDAQAISQTFDVSKKTVYRMINKLNQEQKVVESQRGRGYRLRENRPSTPTTEQDEQRQFDLAINLLHAFPHGLNRWHLLEKLYISESTLQRDLSILNDMLHSFHISIDRSAGEAKVVGTEVQVRKALNYFLLENTVTQQVVEGLAGIFPDISKTDQTFISSQMTLIEKELDVEILDPYTVNIFSHLYILLDRVRTHNVELATPTEINHHYDELLLRVARQVINNISEYAHVEINSQEIENLMLYLVGLRYDRTLDNSQEDEARQLVDYLIHGLPLPPHVNIENLRNALIGHVRPMIHRMKEDMLIVNPILNDIRFSYEETFSQVQLVLQHTQYDVSEDEIGFLTLYVVRALEEASVKKRVLLMCSTGIGTAQLLQTKVRRAFPDFDIVGTISARDYELNLKKFEQIDLVISTVAIHFQPASPVIQVSALFNESDRRKVEDMLYG